MSGSTDHSLIPREELHFQLYEVQDTESLCQRERFAEHNKEIFEATLDTAEKIAIEQFATHNQKADQQEPTFDGHKVSMIDEVKQAIGQRFLSSWRTSHRGWLHGKPQDCCPIQEAAAPYY